MDGIILYLIGFPVAIIIILGSAIYIDNHDRMERYQNFLDSVGCKQLVGWAIEEKSVLTKLIFKDTSRLDQYEIAIDRKECQYE